jgi:hypothetical protein
MVVHYDAPIPNLPVLSTVRPAGFDQLKNLPIERVTGLWATAPDAVKTRNETAGNEWERIGTGRSETTGESVFCLVNAGVRVPFAPPR